MNRILETTQGTGGTVMSKRISGLSAALILLAAGSSSVSSPAAAGNFKLQSTVAFSTNRDHVSEGLTPQLLGAEVYLAEVTNPDSATPTLTNLRRLTDNTSGDGFANLSPDGKKIIFDSDRLTAGTLCNGVRSYNVDDLFSMNGDGAELTHLTRGSSVTWSPDSKNIAFHASASYYASDGLVTGCPIRTDPGSATSDSDIFVVNVDDLLAGVVQPTNITNSPDWIDDDPDWSPDGQKIVFTRHPVTDNPRLSNQAELYLINPDGSDLQRLTFNQEEERAPAWAPDGTRIVFMCRIGAEVNPMADFEICVMNADGTGLTQLTDNSVFDGTPTFSPDGRHILFHRTVGGPGSGNQQLFIMNASLNADGTLPTATQLTTGSPTSGDGVNNLAHWGELRVKG
jgi:TolB protein